MCKRRQPRCERSRVPDSSRSCSVRLAAVLIALIDVFVPGFQSSTDARSLFDGLAVVVIIAVAGYYIGADNDRFLTGDEFKIAGSDRPQTAR